MSDVYSGGEPTDQPDDNSADPVDTSADPEEGTYAEPGAYSNADGTTGYAGLQSDPAEQPLEGDYPASVGAAFAVGALGIDLAVGIAGVEGLAGGVVFVASEFGGAVLGEVLGEE